MGKTCYKEKNEEIIKRTMLVKVERKMKKGRPRMRWMDIVEKDLRNLGVINWMAGEIFRAGQAPERVVVPIIIIIINNFCVVCCTV
jgi:hypothetical protein